MRTRSSRVFNTRFVLGRRRPLAFFYFFFRFLLDTNGSDDPQRGFTAGRSGHETVLRRFFFFSLQHTRTTDSSYPRRNVSRSYSAHALNVAFPNGFVDNIVLIMPGVFIFPSPSHGDESARGTRGRRRQLSVDKGPPVRRTRAAVTPDWRSRKRITPRTKDFRFYNDAKY